MSRWTAPSDLDYWEALGNPTGSGDGNTHKPAFCVACQTAMTLLQAGTHRANTGHSIRYKGRLVTLGIPDRVVVKVGVD